MNQAITVRISDGLRKELEQLSKIKHIPISDLVRDSIRKYIAVNHFRTLREKTLPFAEAQGILTDDDVFEKLT